MAFRIKRFNIIFTFIPNILTKLISSLGHKIGANPFAFAGMSFLLAILLGTGMQRIDYVTNTEFLFVPEKAIGLEERKRVESLFSIDYASNYIPGHESRFLAQVVVVVIAKDPVQDGIAMHNGLLELAKKINDDIHKLQIHSRLHGSFQFKDVCAKTRVTEGLKCQSNDHINLSPTLDLIREGKMNMTFPLFKDPYARQEHFVPLIFGNLKYGDNNTVVTDASATKLLFILDGNESNHAKTNKVDIWEEAVLEYVLKKNWTDPRYDVYAMNSLSLEKELAMNIDSAFVLLNFSVAFIAAFTIMNGFTLKSAARGTPLTALWGIINTLISTVGGWGLLIYTGAYPWQAINLASAVLLLGVGIDDTFVMLSAWHRQSKPDQDLPTNLAETYKEAAVSITITSMTNIVSFAIGALMPGFKTVSIFCAYTAVGLLAVYLWTLFFFGAVIALSQEASQKVSQSDSVKKSLAYCPKLKSFGQKMIGFAFEAPSLTPFTTVVFERWLPGLMMRPPFKLLIVAGWIAMLSVSGYLVSQIQEGLKKSRVGRHNSTVANFYNSEDKYFSTMNYRIDIIIDESGLDYSDPHVQDNITDILARFQSLPLMSNNSEVIENWLAHYLSSPFSKDKDFITGVKRFLNINKKTPLPMNIKFNGSQIQASRFFMQSGDIPSTNAELELVKSLRQVAKSSVYNVTVFHPFFPYIDQFAEVYANTINCLFLGTVIVVVVTVVLIPNWKASVMLVLAIISIEVCVIGFMVKWDINLDVISMITLIMCIGFSVDFCAHICNHFFISESIEIEDRMRETLAAYGAPIFQGGISTLLAVAPLFWANSYILETFSKMVTLVITLGVAHGVLILPIFLMGISCDRRPSETSTPSKSH